MGYISLTLEKQAYLRNIVGLVLDYHNKARQNFFSFPVHIQVIFTLYCSLLNVH